HHVESATDGLFNSVTGQIIDLRNPTEEMIEILSLSTALSHVCRFGGQVQQFYSVAQHSVLVCALAPENLKREALLHDAAEAYLGDVIKPLKVMIEPLYGPLEFKFQQAINQKLGLNIHKFKALKAYDLHALEL